MMAMGIPAERTEPVFDRLCFMCALEEANSNRGNALKF
jgi:hypothetical protein